MRHLAVPLMITVLFISGCGRESRERTLSILNTEADRWDGGNAFVTAAIDAYERPIIARVDKTALSYVLELRSTGPDGLEKNSDDIIVHRSKRHGETTRTDQAAKAAEGVTAGAASGAVKGIKTGLGLGGKDDKKKN